jgi:hypothetical protein
MGTGVRRTFVLLSTDVVEKYFDCRLQIIKHFRGYQIINVAGKVAQCVGMEGTGRSTIFWIRIDD